MIGSNALALMLVSVAVAVLPAVARTLRIPSAVAEILLGVVLGESLLHLQFGGQWLPFLAELGFLILMFQAGMEIDFAMLARQSRGRLLFQVLFFAITVGLAGLAAWLLGQGFFLALVLSTTSLGLVMPILKEAGLSRKPLGQHVLIAASLADFLTLLAITFYVLWHQFGASWRMIAPLPLFAGFGLLLWAGRLLAWWYPERAAALIASSDTQERGMRYSLALLFIFVAASELEHIEPVLGAFMGGAILSFVFREKGQLESKLSALGFGFLIPLFFIHVGMQFDIGSVLTPSGLTFTAVLLVCAFAVKVLPALLLTLEGYRLRDALRSGLLLSSRLSLIVAAAAIGEQEGFLTTAMKDALVLLALCTCLLGPVGFRLLAPRGRAG